MRFMYASDVIGFTLRFQYFLSYPYVASCCYVSSIGIVASFHVFEAMLSGVTSV